MRRRDFMTALIGAAGSPLAARAQQPAMPVIGLLTSVSPDREATRLRAFHEGLKAEGFVAGENVTIEYRSADGQYDRLPALAAELARRQVALIVAAGGTPSAVAAQVATSTIPILFEVSVDPVTAGFVASLKRPGGNLTGVTNQNVETGPKLLELLHELVPAATLVGVLVNPTSPRTITEPFARTIETAAQI